MHEVSPPAIVRRYFSNQAFLLQGQETANQVHFAVKKETQRGRNLLRYCLYGRGRLLLSGANGILRPRPKTRDFSSS